MKHIKFFVIIIISVLLVSSLYIIINEKNKTTTGSGNVMIVTASIQQSADKSYYEAIIVKGNADFKAGERVKIAKIGKYFERVNNELNNIDDLSNGDTVKVMYFKRDENKINTIRAIERIGTR